MVNCQLTLVLDHFFPHKKYFSKIVVRVLELGLVPVQDLVSGPIENQVQVLEPGPVPIFNPELGPGLNFPKIRPGSNLVLGNLNQVEPGSSWPNWVITQG